MSAQHTDVPSEFVLEDGSRLHTVRTGAADPEVTVLLAHGYALDHRTWSRQLETLDATTQRPVATVAYDHRGHGRSDAASEETATIEQLGDDMAELIERGLPERPVVVVGHSMGGMAAMALAERHPRLFHRRVAAMVFVSTAAGGLSEASLNWPNPVGKLVRELERSFGPLVRKVRERIEPLKTAGLRWWLFGEEATERDLELTAEMVWAQWPDTIALFRPAFDRYDRTAALTVAEGTPVTALVGDSDKLCPTEHAATIVRRCGNGHHEVLTGAGHMLPLERHREVTTHVSATVDGLAGSG